MSTSPPQPQIAEQAQDSAMVAEAQGPNIKQMKEVVKQLKGASKMHAAQAAKIEKMIKKMPKKKK